MTPRKCSEPDCDRKHYGRGLCRRHWQRAYLAANPDLRQQRAEARSAHREANPERTAAYNRAYYAANREREAERCREWRQANPERHRTNAVRWQQENPEKARAQWSRKHARRYAAMRATADGPVDYAAVVERHGMWCYLCEQDIDTLADLHLDHVIPLALGGPHTEANLRPTHARCNQKKGARSAAPTERRAVATPGVPQAA